MPYKHVSNLTGGLVTAVAPTEIPDGASPWLSAVIIKDGEVLSDFGHTAFPTAGLLKSNKLHGIFMRADQYLQATGTNHLIARTTTNCYEYNTTTTTWDCISKGKLLSDCETAWVAKTNVTATADTTTKLRGSKSAKFAIADAFTTGLVATVDFTAVDMTAETAVHFWIYSSIALAAGDYQLVLDDTAACASPLESIDIPAVAASTWTPICISLSAPAALSAVISVGLKAITSVVGAQTIYLDDIRSVLKYTGTASNLWSVTQFNDYQLATNGVDQPRKYSGVLATGEEFLATALVAGTISTSEIVLSAKDHVVLFNNTENGADAPLRASWGNVGQLEDYVNGTAGYQDMTDTSGWIIAVEQLSENKWAVYKEDSIVEMDWVGGQTPFRFTTMVQDKTIAGKSCVLNINGVHTVIGTKSLYAYAGSSITKPIDTPMKRSFFATVDYTYLLRSFMMYVEEDDEIQFWVPTTTAYPDTVYCIDTASLSTMKQYSGEHNPWYVKSRTMTGVGSWLAGSALTIGDLIGTIGEQNFTFGSTVVKANTPTYICGDSNGYVYKLDRSTLNNAGVAITNEWQSKDFTSPKDSDGGLHFKSFRVPQVIFEAKGQSITVEYSTDGGSTWNPCQGSGTNTVSLVSIYTMYQLDMDVVCTKIRFRFRNTTASSGYYLRYFGFKWLPRSTRK